MNSISSPTELVFICIHLHYTIKYYYCKLQELERNFLTYFILICRPYKIPVKNSLRSINKQPKKNINAKVINDLGLDFFSKYILYKLSMFKPMPNKIINFISPLSNIFYNSPKLCHIRVGVAERHQLQMLLML